MLKYRIRKFRDTVRVVLGNFNNFSELRARIKRLEDDNKQLRLAGYKLSERLEEAFAKELRTEHEALVAEQALTGIKTHIRRYDGPRISKRRLLQFFEARGL